VLLELLDKDLRVEMQLAMTVLLMRKLLVEVEEPEQREFQQCRMFRVLVELALFLQFLVLV
jgi:hypothetical protein